MKKASKIIVFVVFACLCMLFFVFRLSLQNGLNSAFKNFHTKIFYSPLKTPIITSKSPEPWLTIFVHGSFCSLLGCLSFARVIQDDLEGTVYLDVTKKMRYDPFFYRDQPILEKGLIPLSPTFDVPKPDQKKYAIYPLVKAYEEILNQTYVGREKNYFYAFGWSGLISQQRRRLEAIRFYNLLHEELAKFHKRGIYPKIRLIAHSHGGNLCLNLAAVVKILNLKNFTKPSFFSEKNDENESLKQMFMLIKQLGRKEDLHTIKGQKRFSYVPLKKQLTIDQLILFGTPIQPETEFFFLSDVFKKIYHFYSEEDIIQQLDWITTKQRFSNQRLRQETLQDKRAQGKIIQAKIMYDRDKALFKQDEQPQVIPNVIPSESQESKTDESLWQKIVTWGGLLTKKSNDPTHKKLWFLSWEEEHGPDRHHLSPLPTVTLTPLLLSLLEHAWTLGLIDVDINISASQKMDLEISLLNHNEFMIKGQSSIAMNIIDTIKNKLKPWKPDDTPDKAGVNALYRHLL